MDERSHTAMDMHEALRRAAAQVEQGRVFDVRAAFGTRVGRHVVFPIGLGSALAKAVREGYLVVVDERAGRRGRSYRFTSKPLPTTPTDSTRGGAYP